MAYQMSLERVEPGVYRAGYDPRSVGRSRYWIERRADDGGWVALDRLRGARGNVVGGFVGPAVVESRKLAGLRRELTAYDRGDGRLFHYLAVVEDSGLADVSGLAEPGIDPAKAGSFARRLARLGRSLLAAVPDAVERAERLGLIVPAAVKTVGEVEADRFEIDPSMRSLLEEAIEAAHVWANRLDQTHYVYEVVVDGRLRNYVYSDKLNNPYRLALVVDPDPESVKAARRIADIDRRADERREALGRLISYRTSLTGAQREEMIAAIEELYAGGAR